MFFCSILDEEVRLLFSDLVVFSLGSHLSFPVMLHHADCSWNVI